MENIFFILFYVGWGLWSLVQCESSIPRAMNVLIGDGTIKALLAWSIWPVSVLILILIHWSQRRADRRAQIL